MPVPVAFPAVMQQWVFQLPLPTISRFRETGAVRPGAPYRPARLGSLLFFSGQDIEDGLASENVRSWGKETSRC